MSEKKQLIFLAPSLIGGGTQKVIVNLVNNISIENIEVTLVLLEKKGPFIGELRSDLQVIDLEVSRARFSVLKLMCLFRKKPAAVVSFLGYLNLWIAILIPFYNSHTRFIARESTILSYAVKLRKHSVISMLLYKWLYPRFNMIICQCEFMRQDLIKKFGIKSVCTIVINNPVDTKRLTHVADVKDGIRINGKKMLLAVGRLEFVKGFDLLLRALQLVQHDCCLLILGNGSEEANLKLLASELGVGSRVRFEGFKENPYTYMKSSDLLVLSSRYEGFPNVVIEANACDLPVVAFDCPGGTHEIIADGINGWLARDGDYVDLAECIDRGLKTITERKITTSKIVQEKYSTDVIIPKYQACLIEQITLLGNNGGSIK